MIRFLGWSGAVACLLFMSTMEARTFTVVTTSDSGDGSFRWAVDEANNAWPSEPDTISFAIPITDGGYDPLIGVWTIRPEYGQFPLGYELRDDGTFVDGYSQALFIGGDPNPLGPEIAFEGPTRNAGGITIRGDNTRVQGLAIHSYRSYALMIAGWPPPDVAESIVVQGCYLNVDPTGTYVGGESTTGLVFHSSNGILIGGELPDEGNIISGATQQEVSISNAGNIDITNNLIGTDRTGTTGLGGHNCVVAYDLTAPVTFRGNVIATDADPMSLVVLSSAGADSGYVRFIQNRIGMGLDGSPMGGGTVIRMSHSPHCLFQENIIAYGHSWGGMELQMEDTDYVTITRNSFYGCRGGINLMNPDIQNFHGVDYADGVYGPGVNEEIDTPLCESISAHGDSITVYFKCMPDCVVEVFIADPAVRAVCSEPGYGYVYSGMTYLGDAEETVCGPVWSTYAFSISPALPVGTLVTCTATNQNGSTSEFGCTCRVGEVGTTEPGCIPAEYVLGEPEPNPFSESTTVVYRLPEPGSVELAVFDLAGSRVATLAAGEHERGVYGVRWDGKNSEADPVSSGTYIMRFVSSGLVESRRVVIVR